MELSPFESEYIASYNCFENYMLICITGWKICTKMIAINHDTPRNKPLPEPMLTGFTDLMYITKPQWEGKDMCKLSLKIWCLIQCDLWLIPWLVMSWLHWEPGHQQTWYWGRFSSVFSATTRRVNSCRMHSLSPSISLEILHLQQFCWYHWQYMPESWVYANINIKWPSTPESQGHKVNMFGEKVICIHQECQMGDPLVQFLHDIVNSWCH